MAKVTSRDVAREAGVSQNTVSLVLRNSARVRPETQLRVRAAMKRLDYHPNAMAAALRSQKTPALLFAVRAGAVHHHVTAALLAGAIDAAAAHGHSVLVSAVPDQRWGAAADLYRARWVRGAVVFAACVDDPLVASLVEAGCPAVSLLQPSSACPPNCVVRADDLGGARAAVAHLAERRPGPLGLVAPTYHDSALAYDRVLGARQAAAVAGRPLLEEVAPTWTADAGRVAGLALLGRRPRPAGIFAASDRLAFGVMAAAAELGLTVPGDVAVVGFDDTEASRYTTPPLTTVEFAIPTIGRMGVERLLGHMDQRLAGVAGGVASGAGDALPGADRAGPELVPARLIVRGSS